MSWLGFVRGWRSRSEQQFQHVPGAAIGRQVLVPSKAIPRGLATLFLGVSGQTVALQVDMHRQRAAISRWFPNGCSILVATARLVTWGQSLLRVMGLTVWPCGSGRPLASNLNLLAGQTTPNLVITKVGAGGNVCLFSQCGVRQRPNQEELVTASLAVSGILYATRLRDDHPSVRLTRGVPEHEVVIGRTSRPCPLLCLAPSGVCRAVAVTCRAGALLPHRCTLTCDQSLDPSAVSLCCTVREVAPTWLSPALCSVESRLSSISAPESAGTAIIRQTRRHQQCRRRHRTPVQE